MNNISGCLLIVPIDEHGESKRTISNFLSSEKFKPFTFLIFAPKPNLDKLSFPKLAIANSLIKQQLSKASISLEAYPHYGLGLDVYTQATSPIRRYSDLLVQRQVINHIENKSLLDISVLTLLIEEQEALQRNALDLMRQDASSNANQWFIQNRHRRWHAFFLRQLRRSENLILLHFDDIEMDIACSVEIGQNASIGEKFQLSFIGFDSDSDIPRFVIVEN